MDCQSTVPSASRRILAILLLNADNNTNTKSRNMDTESRLKSAMSSLFCLHRGSVYRYYSMLLDQYIRTFLSTLLTSKAVALKGLEVFQMFIGVIHPMHAAF
eukprot:6173079-Pleurochrysis_carterae.AAC.1